MRKKDIPILVVLFALLFLWPYIVKQVFPPPPQDENASIGPRTTEATNATITAAVEPAPASNAPPVLSQPIPVAAAPAVPGEAPAHAGTQHSTVSISNEFLTLTMSSWGGGISGVELHKFRRTSDKNSGTLAMDFSGAPALSCEGIPGLSTNFDFEIAETGNTLTATRKTADGLLFKRTIETDGDYSFKVTDEFVNMTDKPIAIGKHGLSVGPMRNGEGETTMTGLMYLGIDSQATHGGEATRHWGMGGGLHGAPSLVQNFLPEHLRSGCSWFKPPLQKWLDPQISTDWNGETEWIAAKNKFFVQILSTSDDASGSSFTMRASREVAPPALRVLSQSGRKQFALSRDEMRIGRAPDSDITPDDPSVPSNCCTIVREGWSRVLVANNTESPVKVNGSSVSRKTLNPGDVIRIGNTDMAFIGGEHPDRRDTWAKSPMLSEVSAALNYDGRELKPGQSLVRTTDYYVGPKKYEILKGIGKDSVMEFGFWTPVCKILMVVLNALHWAIPNYGVAIILLTILIRLIFWPVMKKSTDTMKKMQELQPKLKALKDQCGNDQQKFVKKQQELFKEHKVSPLGGCLPMLIQLPVLYALFIVLRSTVEMRFSGFLWISDLSEPEGLLAGLIPFWPYQLNLLPIIMTATTIWQQKLTPTSGDMQQQKMLMIMMPIMFLFMFYNMASALVLYWTTSQVLAIADLMIRQKRDKAKAALARA